MYSFFLQYNKNCRKLFDTLKLNLLYKFELLLLFSCLLWLTCWCLISCCKIAANLFSKLTLARTIERQKKV